MCLVPSGNGGGAHEIGLNLHELIQLDTLQSVMVRCMEIYLAYCFV